MPKILHIIDALARGGAARSMIAIAKYSARLDEQFHHQVISLKQADPGGIELAQLAGMQYLHPVDEIARNQLIAEADIVHVHYWNNPQMFSFLHSDLPPTRLILWFHVSGDNPPQIITRDLINYADFAIPCNPHSYDLPVFKQLTPEIRQKKVGMVYDAADFERVQNVQPKPHDGFNVGYMGTLSFSKMHPQYISMSAKANIPDVKFILCGGGTIDLLQQQASELNALHKFDFRGFVEDIASVIAEFDVYGYPLCEDTYAAAELNLQEVMYAGIPPVVFPHGGIKKLIIHNYTGLIVNSELEYSQALEYLYHNPQERLRLGKNAKEYAAQIFGAENAAKQLNPIYHRLLENPKRSRQWSIPVDGNLLDEPVSMLDLVDIPPQFEGAKTFVESLGNTAPQFLTNLTSENDNDLLISDEQIANSSTLLALGEGGIIQYHLSFPEDDYLRFWTALILIKQGTPETLKDALNQLVLALNRGLNHWRLFWYLAQVAATLQETKILQYALNNIDHYVPNFQPAQTLKQKLNQLLSVENELAYLNLSQINYLIFPDWQTELEELALELHDIIKEIALKHNQEKVTILFDIQGSNTEEAGLLLSDVALKIMFKDNLDISENVQISCLDNLTPNQWQHLLPKVFARLTTKYDSQDAINQLKADSLFWLTLTATGNNYIIFPDWQVDEETLGLELVEVIKQLATKEAHNKASLLIDCTGIDLEDANLLISGVLMNILFEYELDIKENLAISLLQNISELQWNYLNKFIKDRLTLVNENKKVILNLPLEQITY